MNFKFYIRHENKTDTGGKKIIEKLDKMKLRNYLCDELDLNTQQKVFIHLKETILKNLYNNINVN